jgi:hypothetical protein
MKRLAKLTDEQNSSILIPKRALDDLRKKIANEDIDELTNAINEFGESSEKQYLFKKINELLDKE